MKPLQGGERKPLETYDAVPSRERLRRRAKVEKVAPDVDPARLVVVRVKVAVEPARGPVAARPDVRLSGHVLRLWNRLVVDVTSGREGRARRERDAGVANRVRRAAIRSGLRWAEEEEGGGGGSQFTERKVTRRKTWGDACLPSLGCKPGTGSQKGQNWSTSSRRCCSFRS